MRLDKLQAYANDAILNNIEEGIHIVDGHGITRVYNRAMSEIEGFAKEDVIGKHLLAVFPDWTSQNSTLLTVLSSGEPIESKQQHYVNLKGKHITTLNTTLPIFDGDVLIGAIEIAQNLTTVSHMSEQIIALQQQLVAPKKNIGVQEHYHFQMLVGLSEAYLEAKQTAMMAAKSASNVLIYGETGTGKELFAQSIHYGSDRMHKPFIGQNCAAIPENLLEGILFGTMRGAFTSAVDRPGLFEQAQGGTLFLDEINSMPLSIQVKLLRVLQERKIRRVGGLKDIPVDVRIITATNEHPDILLQKALMRRDFYYRINVIYIAIPKLAARQSDIPLLVTLFLSKYAKQYHKKVAHLSEALMADFVAYQWIGNVRELQNFIEVGVQSLSENETVLEHEHLPPHLNALLKQQYSLARTTNQSALSIDDDMTQMMVASTNDLKEQLSLVESQLIENALKKYKGNISKAASALNVSRQNLQYKMKKLGLK